MEVLRARNAVADLLVDGNAGVLRVALIVQAGGDCLLGVDYVVVHDVVELEGRYSRDDVRPDHVKDVSRELSRDSHLLNLSCGQDGYVNCHKSFLFCTAGRKALRLHLLSAVLFLLPRVLYAETAPVILRRGKYVRHD